MARIQRRRSARYPRQQRRAIQRRALREDWRLLLGVIAMLVAYAAAIIFVDDRLIDIVFSAGVGALLTTFAIMYGVLGGRLAALPWQQGTWGEEFTEDELRKLPAEWTVEHSVQRDGGDWDHICVSRAGVFLIDSKFTGAVATVEEDALKVGRRVRYNGSGFRGAAVELRDALEELTGRAPFVTAVVAVWGDFEQTHVDGDRVTYMRGTRLVGWLEAQPPKLSPARTRQLASAVTALAGRGRASAA